MADNEVDPHRFDFDLDRGIREQVVEALEKSPILPLSKGACRFPRGPAAFQGGLPLSKGACRFPRGPAAFQGGLPLSKGVGPDNSGIYALYHKRKLVYIGKASKGTTKSERSLRDRLNEHVGKISSRQNITLAEMQCRYLTFASEWWVFAAEFAIIAHYRPKWNESGFGSKTPGKGRPGTERVSRWDDRFPNRP